MDDDDPFGSYGLSKFHLKHKPACDQFFSASRTRLSDYSFANTYIWRDSIHLRWRVLHDCLCVFANGDGGLTLLFPPIGQGDLRAAVGQAMDICEDYNRTVRFQGATRIEYVCQEALEEFSDRFSRHPMSGDYVYATPRMIDLDGGDLASKRQARNRFARRYQARTEPFGPRHASECLRLLRLWHQQHEDNSAAASTSVLIKRSKEELATSEVILQAKQLGLAGMVLYAADQMVGFTFGEKLSQDTCSILVEKTDRNFTGSAQYIFSEFCRQYWADTAWCNVGDDWEIPSLAWTKDSYRPAFRLPKWTVRLVRGPTPAENQPIPARAPLAAMQEVLAAK